MPEESSQVSKFTFYQVPATSNFQGTKFTEPPSSLATTTRNSIFTAILRPRESNVPESPDYQPLSAASHLLSWNIGCQLLRAARNCDALKSPSRWECKIASGAREIVRNTESWSFKSASLCRLNRRENTCRMVDVVSPFVPLGDLCSSLARRWGTLVSIFIAAPRQLPRAELKSSASYRHGNWTD